MTTFDYDKFSIYLRRYRKSDPMVMRIFKTMYKNINTFTIENKRLSSLLHNYQKENNTLKSYRTQSTLMESIPKNISLSKYNASRSVSAISNASSMTNIRAGSSHKKNFSTDITPNKSVKALKESLDVNISNIA
jgi:hypothetical protein